MKNIILSSLMALSFLAPTVGMARPHSDDLTIEIPYEVSRLLLTDEYQAEVEQIKIRTEGRFLRIKQIQRFSIGGSNFIEVFFESMVATNFQWKPAGSIASSFRFGPMGLVEILSIYYKPNPELPGGGASVGNN